MGLYEKGRFILNGGQMEYIFFGQGDPLLIIPGLGDGLASVGKSALQLYFYYRPYARKARIISASRPDQVPENSTTKTMAREYAALMENLGYKTFNVLGISMGGMIAQHLAADFPDRVEKTVFAVTVPELDQKGKEIISGWIEMASNNDFKSLLIDTTLKTFQEPKASRYARLGLLGARFLKPRDFSNFLAQAQACLEHNGWDSLDKIQCPALVISGEKDQITSPELGLELSKRLPRGEFFLLESVGHGGFEERKKDFSNIIWDFLNDKR